MKITDELLYAHAAAGQALWLSTLPDPAELDPFVPSRWFQRKMKKLLRQCRRTPRVNADSHPYTAHFDAGCGRAVDLLTGKNHDFGGGSELPPYSVAFWRCER